MSNEIIDNSSISPLSEKGKGVCPSLVGRSRFSSPLEVLLFLLAKVRQTPDSALVTAVKAIERRVLWNLDGLRNVRSAARLPNARNGIQSRKSGIRVIVIAVAMKLLNKRIKKRPAATGRVGYV